MSEYVEDSNGYYRPIGKKIGCIGHDCEECRNRQNTKPVAYWHKRGQEDEEFIHAEAVNDHCPDCEPLYTAPPKTEPLTEGVLMGVYIDFDRTADPAWSGVEYLLRLCRAVERAHGTGDNT